MSNYATSFDGNKLYYEAIGNGEPSIIFVHGWCCDHSFWQKQIEHFSQQFLVVALDLAGHGKSDKKRDIWTMQAFGRDVQAIVTQFDLQKVVLVGHSMGAPVVVEAAKFLKDRIELVVAVDYFNDVESRLSEENLQEYLQEIQVDFRNWLKTSVNRWMHVDADPKLVEEVVAKMSNADEKMAISAMEYIRKFNGAVEISKLKPPMHLINSDHWPTDLNLAKKYKENTDATIIAGAGHFLMMESPDEFNAILRNLLSKAP